MCDCGGCDTCYEQHLEQQRYYAEQAAAEEAHWDAVFEECAMKGHPYHGCYFNGGYWCLCGTRKHNGITRAIERVEDKEKS